MQPRLDLVTPLDAEIQWRIIALLRTHRRLMFSAIADAFPDCTWHTLLNVLTHMRKQQQVELLAHRWDYEVVLLNERVLG